MGCKWDSPYYMDVPSWRSRRAKNGTVAALQAESFNLRRLDRRTICAVDKVWKGVLRVHWLCAVTHWTLSRMANLRRPVHGALARGKAPLTRPVITRVRNHEKQRSVRWNLSKHDISGHCLHTNCKSLPGFDGLILV